MLGCWAGLQILSPEPFPQSWLLGGFLILKHRNQSEAKLSRASGLLGLGAIGWVWKSTAGRFGDPHGASPLWATSGGGVGLRGGARLGANNNKQTKNKTKGTADRSI